MIRAGKNGPPGKYERWLSSASSGLVGLAMITDRVQVQAWKLAKYPWDSDHSSFLRRSSLPLCYTEN
ncbi:hypothetical protein PIB30_013081 [Stylosanthes scabra]|uniref:Uncharacterized protein n=1 Tax=Stylosanthes scabra TaxID=79078 RepID=A0ABU6U759_9FABA|nr:hypothetical protein [Stylosanthes scabra]